MARARCPQCQQPCEFDDLQSAGNLKVCPACAAAIQPKREAPRMPTTIVDRFPTPPREVSAAVREAYMAQNRRGRVWLYTAGVLSILVQPLIYWLSDHYEIRPLREYTQVMAEFSELPPKKVMEQDLERQRSGEKPSYAVTFVYFNVMNQHRPAMRYINPEDALAIQAYADQHGGKIALHRSPRDKYEFVGCWEYGGLGLEGKVEDLNARNRGLTVSMLVMAVLGWLSAWAHVRMMHRKISIYRHGVFVLADSSIMVDVFQRDLFDKAMDFLKLGKAWTILKLHINVLYLLRTPKHDGMLVLQLAKGVTPWLLKGKVVVCYLPHLPDHAVLVPSDIGTRLISIHDT